MALYALKDIKANPFRNISKYPIRRDKIEALKKSIERTGFWKNIVARKCKDGAEIAYGHHRLTALNEVYGPNFKVELIIEKLDNETMVQIMAHENMTEWGHNVSVEHETVRAVVLAYGNGEIKLPAPKDRNKDHIRYAPSFKLNPLKQAPESQEHPYTENSLAEFIGWVQPDGSPQEKVRDALNALELIDAGLLTNADFEGLSKSAAKVVIQETRRTYENKKLEAEYQRKNPSTKPIPFATHVGRSISEGIKSGDFGYKEARNVGTKLRSEVREQEKTKPDIHMFEKNLARDINRILDFDDSLTQRLDELLKFKDDLIDPSELVKTLETVANRCQSYADKFSRKHKHNKNDVAIESRIN